MDDEVWDEDLYKNWVRGAKGLEFLQEGLATFVGDKAPICREELLRYALAVPIGPLPQCNQCTSENLLPDHASLKKACGRGTCIYANSGKCFGSRPSGRRKCPGGICSKLYDAIVNEHRYRDPLWRNTDPNTWCSDPQGWSFAKCFETTPGPGTSVQDTDAAGLLSFLINSLSMQNWLACPNMGSDTTCIFYKARDIRNEILHTAKMQLDNHTLDGYLDTFIDVLQDPNCLLTDARSQDAVKQLTKLKSKQIYISQRDEKNILKLRKEALSELEERKQEALQELQATENRGVSAVNASKTEAIQQLKDTASAEMTNLNKTKTKVLQEIKDTMSCVNKTKTEALKEIMDSASGGKSEIKETETEALKGIKETASTGLTDLNKVTKVALQEIKDTMSDLNNTKTEALKEMKAATNTGKSEMKETETEALQTIKDTTSAILTKLYKAETDVDKTKTEALKEINNTTSTGISAMKEAEMGALQGIKDTASAGLTNLNKTKTMVLYEIEGARSNLLDEIKKQQTLIVTQDGNQPLTSQGVYSSIAVTGQQFAEVQTPILTAEEAYFQLRTKLQDDLISFYRRQHSKITLSPLVEEDTPLLEFYVMPDIKSVEIKRARGGGTEEKTHISPFRNVFYKGDKLCSDIYLTADAGLGKTALCKRMALAWCHAKQTLKNEKHYFSEEEVEAMNEFRFVFLLLLRDNSSQCDIDAMIMEQIISRLGRDYTLKDLKDIQCKETCLVILDGLDEWTHPSNSCMQLNSNIPHRKARACTVVLTTTRPWKISVCGLKPSDIDQRLEISGLNQESASALKSSVISHLSGEKDEMKLKYDVREFSIAVEKKQISDLEAIPLLLMYLLFLWYYKIELGQSQCDLYSKIVELLLSRTVLKYNDTSSLAKPSQGDIPQCFTTQTRCRQFYSLLTALGHLAFQTLFKETKEENTLVFDSSVAEQYLNKDCLTFCLSTGIITQSKVQGNPMKQESKVSFAHKTVQEFFAALYMHSTPDHTSVPEIVSSKCKCVKDVLDMSTILKFIIGMNVNVASSISRELMKIINEDEITREYRNTPNYISFGSGSHPPADFQDMCISCCKELPRENEVSLCLQDVFIEESCKQEQYREHLKQLTTRNTQNIRSLSINMVHMEDTPYKSVQKVVEYFALNGLENIEKIYCHNERNGDDILPLLYSSVKCLSLSCEWWPPGSWSRLLGERVTSLQKLEAIEICRFDMSHSEWTLLCDYISHRHCMRQIGLWELGCTDHEWPSCTGASLDLSQHSQLSELALNRIPVRTVNVNMAALEECWLEWLDNRDLVLRFVNCDPADSKLNSFKCWGLQSRAVIDTILDTLPGLHQVKRVELRYINLGDRKLKLSPEMKNLERVELERVTMAASSLRGVVDCVDQLPQTVNVYMKDCTITPERELVTVRYKIKTSPRFWVSKDNKDMFGSIKLKFVTIKK